jgi:phospholipid/cholesterol/gamma-HCH transport system substrate-binding protein
MNRYLIVGLFVVAGLGLFATGLFMIGNRHEVFAPHMDFYTEFTNLSGVAKGTKVQVAGMDAGQVLDVGIPDSPSSKFRVKLRINENLHGLVRTDSVVTIGTEGVVGNTFVSISPGSSQASAASAGTTLSSKEPTDLSALLDQAKGTIADIDGTVRNANSLVTNANGLITTVGGNLNSTLGSVKTAVSNVNEIAIGLKEGRGPAGMLLRDEALAGQIRQVVSNTQTATSELNNAATQANGLISDIQSRSFPKKIDDMLASVKDTVSNFDATSQQVRQAVADFAGPDEKGLTAAVNLRESLSNVNTATGNLADDTEALKHNFFFRGFFRRRGYYSMTQLAPNQYRKDRVFASQGNRRSWLKADELFQRSANGAEELRPPGKALLQAAVSQFGGTIFESPIVVEGYSESADGAERLSISRARSIVARNYIQSHFNLDPKNVGAVALENRPPDGLDHAAWNGIAIVLVKARP